MLTCTLVNVHLDMLELTVKQCWTTVLSINHVVSLEHAQQQDQQATNVHVLQDTLEQSKIHHQLTKNNIMH